MPQTQNINVDTAKMKKYLLWCVIADVIWGALVGTFNAWLLYAFASHTEVSGAELLTATIFTWVVSFAVACFQGAIFIGAASVIGFVIYFIFFAARNNGDGNNANGPPRNDN